MVVISYSGREINAKIVYYGPGLGGKTTNLEQIYESVPSANKGKMISMKTKADRTLFFDFLPIDLGEISGFRTRFMLYTVPGQVYYNATRKLVLKGVDGVVFVADSERGKMRENQESFDNLRENLRDYGMNLDVTPLVFQYNKRDLNDTYTCEELDAGLGRAGRPLVEACAAQGQGVLETLREVSALLLRKLRRELGPQRTEATEATPAAFDAAGEVAAIEAPAIEPAAVEAAAIEPPAIEPAASEPAAVEAAPIEAAPIEAAPTDSIAPVPGPVEQTPAVPPAAASTVEPPPVPHKLEVVRFGAAAAEDPPVDAMPVPEPIAAAAAEEPKRLVVPVTIDLDELVEGQSIELVLELRTTGVRRRAG